MSGIRGINSGDPHKVNSVQNQSEVDSAQSVSGDQAADQIQKQEEISEKDKKALQEFAADKVAEEQIKAQVKQIQLSSELDSKSGKIDEAQNKSQTQIHYRSEKKEP